MGARQRVRSEAKHGTLAEYRVYGCRCDACRQAWNDFHRNRHRRARLAVVGYQSWDEYLAAKRSQGPTHGRRSTYVHGCRCADCRKAEADYQWKRRHRAAEAQGREYAPNRDWVLDYRLGRMA